MIVTVTPNPSLDRTMPIAALKRGAVIRATAPASIDPSGKGINVSRALATAGHQTRAVLPLGGPDGRELAELLDFDYVAVPIAQPIRSNVSVVEPDGTVTKFNEPGPVLTAEETTALLAAARDSTERAGWIAACGSLPMGVPVDFYAELVRLCGADPAERGQKGLPPVPVALDSSGPALRAGIAARPALIKPNAVELSEVVDRPLRTLGDVVAAARELQENGALTVLASLGADGAVLVTADGTLYGTAAVPVLRSAVGAGDALLAGFLAGGGTGYKALIEGLAWAAAACALPGTAVPQAEDIDRGVVTITDSINPDLPLH